MNPAMYIFLNRELDMSVGKAAAQAGHAVHLAIDSQGARNLEGKNELYRAWMQSGYTKLVMEARDATHLMTLERYFNEHGYANYVVIDEGRTEVAAHSITALAVEVVDRDDPRAWIFKEFKLYRDRSEKGKIELEPKKGLFGKKKP